MSHSLKRYSQRRGGALAGCLIVLGVLVVLVIVGVVIVVINGKGWVSAGIKSVAEQAIQASDLPESEKTEVLAEVTRLTDGFKSGDISFKQFIEIGTDIAEGPLIPAARVGGFESMYLAPSGLSDEEKEAGGLALSRVAQAVSEDKIEADPLADIFDPIKTVNTTGPGVHINHPKFTLHLKAPKDCTDDELREVIANAVAAADAAEIPNERVVFDVSDEIRAAIDRALSDGDDDGDDDHEHDADDDHSDDETGDDAGGEGP